MKRYRIEFTNEQYAYVYANGLADAYFKAVQYEKPLVEDRFIADIELVTRCED